MQQNDCTNFQTKGFQVMEILDFSQTHAQYVGVSCMHS